MKFLPRDPIARRLLAGAVLIVIFHAALIAYFWTGGAIFKTHPSESTPPSPEASTQPEEVPTVAVDVQPKATPEPKRPTEEVLAKLDESCTKAKIRLDVIAGISKANADFSVKHTSSLDAQGAVKVKVSVTFRPGVFAAYRGDQFREIIRAAYQNALKENGFEQAKVEVWYY